MKHAFNFISCLLFLAGIFYLPAVTIWVMFGMYVAGTVGRLLSDLDDDDKAI
jgi:hypothetical protein